MVTEDDDPFDIWMNLGVVMGGRTRHLELILTQLKKDPKIKLVFTKTSASRLIIEEENAEEYYDEKNPRH